MFDSSKDLRLPTNPQEYPTSNVPEFWQTIAGPGATTYPSTPAADGHAIYYCKKLKAVYYTKTPTNAATLNVSVVSPEVNDYVFVLTPGLELSAGTSFMGFRSNGYLYTIDPVKAIGRRPNVCKRDKTNGSLIWKNNHPNLKNRPLLGCTVDNDGNVWTLSWLNPNIMKFDGTDGTKLASYNFPIFYEAICKDDTTDHIYLYDGWNDVSSGYTYARKIDYSGNTVWTYSATSNYISIRRLGHSALQHAAGKLYLSGNNSWEYDTGNCQMGILLDDTNGTEIVRFDTGFPTGTDKAPPGPVDNGIYDGTNLYKYVSVVSDQPPPNGTVLLSGFHTFSSTTGLVTNTDQYYELPGYGYPETFPQTDIDIVSNEKYCMFYDPKDIPLQLDIVFGKFSTIGSGTLKATVLNSDPSLIQLSQIKYDPVSNDFYTQGGIGGTCRYTTSGVRVWENFETVAIGNGLAISPIDDNPCYAGQEA